MIPGLIHKNTDEFNTVTRKLIRYINKVLNREGYGENVENVRYIVDCFYANVPPERVRLNRGSILDNLIDQVANTNKERMQNVG